MVVLVVVLLWLLWLWLPLVLLLLLPPITLVDLVDVLISNIRKVLSCLVVFLFVVVNNDVADDCCEI